MNNISVRKMLALSMGIAFILFTAYCLYADKTVPESFIAVVSTIVGYYYGKSTALDQPKEKEVK